VLNPSRIILQKSWYTKKFFLKRGTQFQVLHVFRKINLDRNRRYFVGRNIGSGEEMVFCLEILYRRRKQGLIMEALDE